MDVIKQKKKYKSKRVTLALIALSYASSSVAQEFNWGDVEGAFHSQFSVGSSWRVESADVKNLGRQNGITYAGAASPGMVGNSSSGDDGNLNYNRGDAFSQTAKGLHDLTLQYDNFGAFFRGKYWYDYVLDQKNVHHGSATNSYVPNQVINDDDFNALTKAKGVALLDAYIFADFDIGDSVVDLRLGKQVVNWGESSYIQGGINAVNPVDAAAFHRPGAEVKEGLLPVNMLFTNIGITADLAVEAFYQLKFEPTVIDSCGTYFSTSDTFSEGCNVSLITDAIGEQAGYNAGYYQRRGTDEYASDNGQFGLALKYYAEDLNSTVFALYYMNYHSRLPYVSLEAGLSPFNPYASDPSILAKYHTAYPEDIQLLGLSFNTTLSDWAISGEVSHRLGLPLQINGSDLFTPALSASPTGSPMDEEYRSLAVGDTIDGFDRFDYTQTQLTFIRLFDQVLGIDRISTVAEFGFGHVWSLDNSRKYGRSSIYGNSFDTSDGHNTDDGFTTSNSAGYRLSVQANYRNVFSGVDLSPSIAWSHDVYGYSPEPQGTFQEGRRGINLALKADYAQRYSMSLSYSGFEGRFNPISDRDYVSLVFGLSF
ncbi:hypothetical protein AKG98_348 [Moritella sp. JT01]|uniref:DUF1302 domain-containing protein n=1 Tax=Moritella sp. JT01 TaxID=756698 RepID=UPI00079C7C61|nr:DUF1302 domain-containing protein [Moritella sp. JT01]KXO14272.1 hypothetical protein AKG98_348 [Moritella sp. JT01]